MMQRSFSRLATATSADLRNARCSFNPIQQFICSISSNAKPNLDPKDVSKRTLTSESSRRNRAYDYTSPEARFGRHVLRTILRECSYLPDSFAADYIKKHALSRFRTNEYKAWKKREQFESQSKSRRKEARSVISTLQRANEGEREPLLKVLHTAYGRIGKKRHELMKPLLYVEGQNPVLNAILDPTTINVTEQSEATTKLSPSTSLNLTPQLRALLKSQMQARPPTTVRNNPRSIQPSVPELNSWLHPLPQIRIRNARKKHYANLLDRLQPPLPTEEWERLRDLASGKLPAVLAVRRRSSSGLSTRKRGSESELKAGLSALELVALQGRVPKKAIAIDRGDAKRFSARFMRRLYAEVFNQCPLMEYNTAKEEWNVTWGFQALSLLGSQTYDSTGHVAEYLDVHEKAAQVSDGSTSSMNPNAAVG